jgi:hypothetical protein
VAAIAFPMLLIAVTRPLSGKWKATKAAAVYVGFWCIVNWILPLFPAEPKLGPVLNRVTHFVPSFFPLMMVVPAAAVDLLLARFESWPRWKRGCCAGAVFVIALVAVQWPLGSFLMTPWSRNWFFFTHMYDYQTPPTSYQATHRFFPFERTPAQFWSGMGMAVAIAMMGSWLGLKWGAWLERVKR